MPIEYKKVLQEEKMEAINKKIAQVERDYWVSSEFWILSSGQETGWPVNWLNKMIDTNLIKNNKTKNYKLKNTNPSFPFREKGFFKSYGKS